MGEGPNPPALKIDPRGPETKVTKMRFAPKNSKTASPRRRRPGLGGHGPYQPPVLARLPEIQKLEEVEAVKEEGERKFRLDAAHTQADQIAVTPPHLDPESLPAREMEPKDEQVAEVVESAPVSPAMAISAPTLPPLPTAEFAETAAKILARLEGQESLARENLAQIQNATEEKSVDVTPPSSSEPISSLVTVEDHETPGMRRMLRIDPGIPRPGLLGQQEESDILDEKSRHIEKRRMARGHSVPELTELDSPWHDWIVKLGGTFIAGLLLVAAFQSWQPKTSGDYAGTDGEVMTPKIELPVDEGPAPFRVASIVPPIQEPEILNETLNVVAPPSQASGTPVFIDPSDLPESMLIQNPTMEFATEPDELAELAELADTSSGTPFDEVASQLMPAPALSLPNDEVLPMPEDLGNQMPEVAAVIENDLVVSGPSFADHAIQPAEPTSPSGPAVILNDIFGPPSAGDESTAPRQDQPITPIPAVPNGRYPRTGYAPLTQIKTSLPPAPPQQPVVGLEPKPDFSLFPQDGSGGEPKSPISVQLDGTIQQFSR